MALIRIVFDCESFYDKEYSLRKMTPLQYILSPKFEFIGASLRIDTHAPPGKPAEAGKHHPPLFQKRARWIEAEQTLPVLKGIKEKAHANGDKVALVSHNVAFDGAVLAWQFGWTPDLYIDTLGMARATIYPLSGSASLEKVADFLSLPGKGDAIKQAIGLRRDDMKRIPGYWEKYKAYCCHDTDLCASIFDMLAWMFAGKDGKGTIHQGEEFLLMDAVARMTIQPQFMLDGGVLTNHLRNVQHAKGRLVESLVNRGIIGAGVAEVDGGMRYPDLMSNDKFADVLRTLGVEPPTKVSLTTGKETYAFSKQDPDFMELLEDEDPDVQAVVSARLGIKSTLEETRTQRFIDICYTRWPDRSEPAMLPPAMEFGGNRSKLLPHRMPFPLKYSGAHTHRLSGDWSLNCQNLGRASELRRAIIVPEGYEVVGADASQIEARIVSWLAGCTALVEAFRNKEDVYSTFASTVYGYIVDKKTHPGERFVGKTGVLGLGFGMGWPKFQLTCLNQGRAQKLPLDMCRIDELLAQRTVKTYRTTYREVPAFWKLCDDVIVSLSLGLRKDYGIFYTDVDQTIVLPNGMRLFYTDMRQELVRMPDGTQKIQWLFRFGKRTKYTFGGKMTENIVQSLARIITMHAHIRLRKSARIMGARPVLAGQIHDQLLYVAPKGEAEALRDLLVYEMSQSYDWFRTLPLASEGAIGPNLLEAK